MECKNNSTANKGILQKLGRNFQYGTNKRQWGFHYNIKKGGIKRASADVGFMF